MVKDWRFFMSIDNGMRLFLLVICYILLVSCSIIFLSIFIIWLKQYMDWKTMLVLAITLIGIGFLSWAIYAL